MAIRQGIVTPTTQDLLRECELRVAECEAARRVSKIRVPKLVALPTVVKRYLADLRTTLNTDTDRARTLIAKLIGTVRLCPEGEHLVGELRGNLPALLDVEFAKSGAGSPILTQPSTVIDRRTVA